MKDVSIRALARVALLGLIVSGAIAGCAGPATQENVTAAALSISGTPASSVKVGDAYSFQPTVAGAAGTLTYSVQNKPGWATFDSASGRLSGSPQAGDVGTTSNIVISVSDGSASDALPGFSITVNQLATGSATVSWMPPTQNTDGSTLATLAGYRIGYGTSASTLDRTVEITNAGLTSYVIDNLAPGTYYFAVKAFTSSGLESDYSSVASKTIR